MDSQHSRSIVVLIVFLVNLCHSIHGSGCQHQCDCGHHLTSGAVEDDNATLRHEVLGGLCGAFSPILVAALAYLIYKRCCSPCTSSSLGSTSQGAPWDMTQSGGNRGQNRPVPFNSGQTRPPRVSTPTSLYGEMDNDMTKPAPPYFSSNPNGGGTESQWMNIHRNVKTDETNIWLKNVNKIKQFV